MLQEGPIFLPVSCPQDDIFYRLGGNRVRTILSPAESAAFHLTVQTAFSLCTPRGLWRVLPIREWHSSHLTLEGSFSIASEDFARLCRDACAVWCAIVTIGPALPSARDGLQEMTTAAIYDAVGSETADAAMDFLHKRAAQLLSPQALCLSKQRFSPGYGDMLLDTQKTLQEILDFTAIDIRLSKHYFLQPEKTVTALAPIHKTVL